MGIHERREGCGLCTTIKVCLRLFANWNCVHETLTSYILALTPQY